MSGSYALNALDASELPEFEKHLAQSEETRNEVIELTDTAVLLGLAVEPVAPSASLKRSIMDQLDAHPQVRAEGPPASVVDVGPAARKANARWYTRPIIGLTAAAAAIALIFGGTVIANTISDLNDQHRQADQFAALTGADDAQRASMPITGGGTATLVWSESLLSSALIADDLKPLPAGKVYELWYINSAGARPAGTFQTDGGRTWRVLDGAMSAGDAVGVTVEPSGGSKAPTTEPMVVIASA
jgi:anti-sigma-K factor RskA